MILVNHGPKLQVPSGNNKPDRAVIQDLLKTFDLLIFAYLFIDFNSLNNSKRLSNQSFKVLCYPTYLSTQLSQIAMLFLGLINKYRTQFLIPKMLSLAHSSSYVVAVSTLKLILRFQHSLY